MNEVLPIVGPQGTVVARADVSQEDGLFSGTVELSAMPASMLQKFIEYENVVNNQMFSLLDRIQDEVEALGLRARLGESEVTLDDLQIYPSDGAISFRVKGRSLTPAPSVTGSAAAFPALEAMPKTSN